MTSTDNSDNKKSQEEQLNDVQIDQNLIKERNKSSRSRSRQSYRSEASMHEPKEIKFVSFVSKIDSRIDASDQAKSAVEELSLSLPQSQQGIYQS
jgi:hypothetical protein